MELNSAQYRPPEQFMPIIVGVADLKRYARFSLFMIVPIVLATLATFRNWGFDYADGGVKDLYPYVANGWGIWYWFAELKLDFSLFSFILNLIFALQILLLSFPRYARVRSISVPLVFSSYMIFWFLFGQTRYGMAIALIAASAVVGSYPLVIVLGAIATLIHKAAAGGALLALLWIFLQRRRHGLAAAIAISAGLICVVMIGFKSIMLLAGYGNYLNWSSLPTANTPLKFYYLIGAFVFWKLLDRKAPTKYLILTLLFLPFSYFIVFAGRAFEIYVVILFTELCREETPWHVRYPISLLALADLSILVFKSGYFF